MGQKINPISLRLQKTNRKYDSSWYSNYHYGELFLFDLKVRDYLERILKQLKYPEGRALISHFSKGSKINLFAFNPTSSRQQKSGPFGLKGGVRLFRPSRLASHAAQHVKQEWQRKLSPVLAKRFQHMNELKRPLKALSSKSKALSIDQELLLVNQSRTITCSEKRNSVLLPTTALHKQNTNKTANKWNPFLPYLALSWYAWQERRKGQEGKKSLILDEKTLGAKQDPLLYVPSNKQSQVPSNKQSQVPSNNLNQVASNNLNQAASNNLNQAASNNLSNKSKFVPSWYGSGTKCVPFDWQHNGSHLVPFFALKDTFNPSYLLKAKRLRDSCFGTHASASLTQCFAPVPLHQKQQVVSKTLSLWYQRAQGSTHPILVSLGADKKTIPFLTVKPLRAGFEQKQQSFSRHRYENSLYRYHVEVLLDQQTGSSVKLVPFQVSTEKQSALFLAQEVVYFLEKRVSFRKIKDQILKELKNSKIIKGVRITCSGRVGGKSKKAQKAKTETFKQGETSLGVFSSKIDFAQKSALTSFGLIGVKVWICFY